MESSGDLTIYDGGEKEGAWVFFVRILRESVASRHIIYNLVQNNLRSRYRRSYLGFAWSLLNPLLTMTVLAVVFAGVFQQSLGRFGLYIFSGLLPWGFVSGALTLGCASFVQSEGFLRKVRVSMATFPLVAVVTESVNFVFSLVSLLLLAIVVRADVHLSLLALPLAMLLTILFVTGLAVVVGVANVYFRDMPYIISVGLNIWFYTVPILYPFKLLPQALKTLLAFNPLYYYISLFQALIYEGAMPPLKTWGLCVGIAALSQLCGLFFLKSKENEIIFKL